MHWRRIIRSPRPPAGGKTRKSSSPSALAVLRLTINSNFVGSLHRQVGWASRPLECDRHSQPPLGTCRQRKPSRRLEDRAWPSRRRIIAGRRCCAVNAMSRSLWPARKLSGRCSTPPFGSLANSPMARSIAAGSATARRIATTPRDGASASMTRTNDSASRRRHRIVDYSNARDIWCDVLEQTQPFASHRKFVVGEPREITAGMREARHKALCNRIGDRGKYDGNSCASHATARRPMGSHPRGSRRV